MPKSAIFMIVLLFAVVAFTGYMVLVPPEEEAPPPRSTETGSVRVGAGGAGGTGGDEASVSPEETFDGVVDPIVIGESTATESVEGDAEEALSPPTGLPPEDEFEKGEVLVVDPPEGFFEFSRQSGFSIIEETTLPELSMTVYVLRIPAGSTVRAARTLLEERFPKIITDVNHLYRTKGLADYARHVARRKVGWRKVTAACGAGVRIGMVDAPLDLQHPAFKGRHVIFRSFHRTERRTAKADHGTAIAAMLVGTPEWGGLLPGAELRAANIFDIDGTGRTRGNANGLIKAVEWLLRERVDVINFSLAGADNKGMRRAIYKARRKGMLMVAAVGDWGSDLKSAYPAAYKDVIAVTAIGPKRRIYKKANRGRYIDFAAPGVRIYTAVPGGGRLQSGTSFAVPYITALTGFLAEKDRKMDSRKLRRLFSSKTIDLGDPGRDNVFGWGFVKLQPKCR